MPIHDQSYRHYEGMKTPPGRGWMVIASAGIKSLIRKRVMLGLLVLSQGWFVGYAVWFYFTANYANTVSWAMPGPDAFRSFLDHEDFFVFVITVYVGAGLIANDHRANALQIYLSKPLMRTEYIAGKFAVLFTFLMGITFVPDMLLLLLKVAFDGNFTFISKNLFLLPAIALASLLEVTLISCAMLALSSLSKSSRFVAIMYVGVLFFTKALFAALYAITATSAVSWISVGDDLAQVVDVIFRIKPRYATPWEVSLLVVVAVIAISISILERRVRGVEVVT